MRRLTSSAALLLTGLLAACGGGNKSSISVTVSPSSSTVILSVGTQQFIATVAGSNNTCVSWAVSQGTGTPVVGGNATLGTITNSACTTTSTGTTNNGGNGLYTAPAALPNPATLVITATADADKRTTGTAAVTVDSGIRVQVTPANPTIGTGDTFQFTATVNGTANTSVTWSVNNVAGGSSTTGTISATGLFTAPASPETVTISATSGTDTSKSGSTQAVVVTAANPVLASLDISTVSQGEIQQDFYATGSNFLATSTLTVSGTAIPTAFLSQTFLRGRIPASLLAAAGALPVAVKPQHGTASSAINVTVAPQRPAIIASTPDSAPANGGAAGSTTVGLTGGYYSPSTTAEFNGAPKTATISNPRQLVVGLSASDLANPGLFPLVLHTAGTPALSSVNLAVTPPPGAALSAPAFTLAVGTSPVAVAINTSTGVAAVLNQGPANSPGTVNLVDLKPTTPTVGPPIAVGNVPTGIAVDNLLNEALVVNSKDNTLSVVNMGSGTVTATLALPAGTVPFSVGVNPLTHRAIVANQQTNIADIIDDSTNPPTLVCTVGGDPNNVQSTSCLGTKSVTQPVSTGLTPQIAVEDRLNWAVVTPGGSGTITIVDLGKPAVVGDVGRTPNPFANLTISPSLEGVAINPETEQALLTDPNATSAELFSVLDQTVSPISLNNPGLVAAAADQLSDLGVVVNAAANTASVIDLRTQLTIVTVALGANANPAAVAVDPVSSLAVTANKGNGTVSILQLGAVRSLQVVQTSPPVTFNSINPLVLTVIGNGFVPGSLVRLDESSAGIVTNTVAASCTTFCRELTATIPANLLSGPRRFMLDVRNPDGSVSNASDFTVIESVPVGAAPVAVAVDAPHNQAVVTNSGDGTISVVNLANGTASVPLAVGSGPVGVAVVPRLQRAIVTNNTSNTAAIVDLVHRTVATVPLPNGSSPQGVAVDLDTDIAVIANEGSNSVSLVSLDSGNVVGTVLVDTQPVAVAIDPALNVAAVTTANSGTLDIINMSNGSLQGRASGFQVPTGVALDPTNDVFLVANSLLNVVTAVDPVTLSTGNRGVLVGINPTSIDYNFQSSTLVTVNTASNTVSITGFLAAKGQSGLQIQLGQVRAVLDIAASSQSSVGINELTNVAVIVDQANNRVLLVPLPR